MKDKNPKFKEFKEKISLETLQAIEIMGFKRMTNIQAEVLPKALSGADIVATAKTGSGKTLAFLIPTIETVIKSQDKQISGQIKRVQDQQRKNDAPLLPLSIRGGDHLPSGTCCVIVSPTRELATQTYCVLNDLLACHKNITSTLVIGGEHRKAQSAQLSKGIHIVVSTPGRLFDHMRTKEFDYKHVKCLVLDEADKIFQYGFEEDIKQIINILPKDRQTMLFSATESERTEALIKSAMKDDLLSINTDQDDIKATVDGLKQGYAVCETEYRLWWLHKLLKKTQNSKIMVFFSSCKSVVFHYEFFSKYCHMPVLCIHGKMNQMDRNTTISNFYDSEKMAFFCTDLAARGLDIPAVDWIVQFDPPGDANEYIHRVGRTARGLGAAGNAVLLLRPDEIDFVSYLQESKIFLDKYEAWNSFSNLQPKLDKAMADSNFTQLAVEAFEGYIRALEVRKLKHIFNLLTMDLDAVARSFGLKNKPDVDLHIGFSKKHRPRKRIAAMLATKGDETKRTKL